MSGDRGRQNRWQEDEVDKSKRHRAQCQRRAYQYEIHESECANERKQYQKSNAKARTQARICNMPGPGRHSRSRGLIVRDVHAGGLSDGNIDEDGACEVEHGEKIKIPGDSEMVGDGSRDQPSEQVARDITGNVGGKRAASVGSTAFLAKIGEGERE